MVEESKGSGISAIVLTKNEVENIKYCLGSLQWCDEIIVVDSNSTDGTKKIIKENGAKLLEKNSESLEFDHLRNYGLKESKNEWIFVLDADEMCPKSLANEIQDIADNGDYGAYRVPRINYFGSEPRKTAPWPDYQMRLYQKEVISFGSKIHEFNKVEERTEIKNLSPEEVAPIYHFGVHNVSELISKIDMYTSIQAQEAENYSLLSGFVKSLYDFFQSFIKNFIYKKGFLRPRETLLFVFSSALSTVLLEFKKWRIVERGTDEEIMKSINQLREEQLRKYDGE